ncbi:MAG: flippase [Planctomycetota bacterium]|jgi:O-antigen/teichoic acid export membrane protein
MQLFSIKEIRQKLRSDGHGGVLARGAIGSFTVKITGAGILFFLHILLARILGTNEYGIYIFAFTWINILVMLCLLGFQTSLVRFIPKYKAKQEWGLLRGILRWSTILVLVISILFGMAGIAFIWSLAKKMTHEQTIVFFVAFTCLPFFCLCKLREASLRALKKVVQSELLLRVFRPLLLGLFAILLFFLAQGSLRASQTMGCNLISVLVVFLVGTVFLKRELPHALFQSKAAYEKKEWLKVSLPLLLITGMHLILKRTDIVMLGILRGPSDAGIYSAASRISDLVVFGLLSINSILAPIISELYHTGRKKEMQRIITSASRAIFIFTLSASFILIIFGKFALSLFGTKFIIAFVPLLILLIGQVIHALTGPANLLMKMTGHQNALGLIIVLSGIANIILNAVLIPFLGLNGAAISTALIIIIRKLIVFYFAKRHLKIDTSIIQLYVLKRRRGD